MPFVGEDRYRAALIAAEGHESISAMVRVEDLKGALAEIERQQAVINRIMQAIADVSDLLEEVEDGSDDPAQVAIRATLVRLEQTKTA